MMRVADYIADYIYRLGIREVFMVSGGGMMFLSDGIARHSRLQPVCNHHEQASAMAAVGYSRLNDHLGVAYLTTGCGGTNAITGVLSAWQDSIPCLFISGQSKRKETVRNSGLRLRQLGVQEADIIPVVRPLTKYAEMVNDPQKIAFHLDEAVYLARSGRPGPVWLDVPLDVQAAPIDETSLERFAPSEKGKGFTEEPSREEIAIVAELLHHARRPVVIAGHGIRLGGAIPEFLHFIRKTGIPVVASRLGFDVIPTDDPLFIGRVGVKGDRAGNLAVQNSDVVISLGCRLSISFTGYEYQNFAREARIVVVDIDPEEHRKKTVRIDTFINADVKKFLVKFKNLRQEDFSAWTARCQEWKGRYPVCLPEYAAAKDGINTYHFVSRLCQYLRPDAVVVANSGSPDYVFGQSFRVKAEQRFINSAAQGEMGFTIPAAIGACFANGRKEVIAVTGDGALQMNIQELQTIVHYKLPIKLFIWNNDGYLCIRATQMKFFDGRLIGADRTSGVSFPELHKISAAYGIEYFRAPDTETLDTVIRKVLEFPGAAICEVMCLREQEFLPTVLSRVKPDGTMVSMPLEDMYPFLDREEFLANMIVKPVEE
jgi:acetolactate synthase I/II/III large subunit